MYSQVVYTVINDRFVCHLLQYDEPLNRPQDIVIKEIPKEAILITSSKGYYDPDAARNSIKESIEAFQDFDNKFTCHAERNYYNDMFCRPTSIFYIHPNYENVYDRQHVGWLVKREMVNSYFAKMRKAINKNQLVPDIHLYLDEFEDKLNKQPVPYPNLKESIERWRDYQKNGFPLKVSNLTELIPIDVLKFYYVAAKN